MSRRGIVNVRMVITEEKILSNIDKVQKLINPNSKKQIVELEEDSFFKDLVESIKSYISEYPKKKNFPVNVYKATYGLVEFATMQFEENTKKIEELIKKREDNIALSGVLKEAIQAADEKQEGWKNKVDELSDKFEDDIIDSLKTVGKSKSKKTENYLDAMKFLKARANNLESNLHIEIDMERLEDSSKALSYIGIEVADALKQIPVPEEQLEAVAIENAKEEEVKNQNIEEIKESKEEEKETVKEIEEVQEENDIEVAENVEEDKKANVAAIEEKDEGIAEVVEKLENSMDEEKEQYAQETTFEAKPSLWQRFKKSKFVQAATFIFRIKVRIELPSNALPEGRGEN